MQLKKSKKTHPVLRELALPVASFAVVAALVVYGAGSVDGSTDGELCAMIEQSITRAAVQCYALEGSYPPDLDYLTRHYGLSVDEDKYVVHYENIGGNLLPGIRVFPLKG